MRVALFSRNARSADAIGQQMAAKLAYFQQLGAEVRVYLSEGQSLRPEVAAARPVISTASKIWRDTVEREYLLSCDLVVAEYGAAYDLIELLPALGGQGPRIIVDYRGVTPVELGDAGLQAELEAAARQRSLLWSVDAVLVQSQFAAGELHESIGLPRVRMHVIPCWMATPRADEVQHVDRLRQKYGLSKAKVVLFVGRLARNKQPELLIEALAKLDNNIHAVFVGCQHDAYREQLNHCQAVASKLHVAERVHFVGTVNEEELAGWFRAADVLVLPSRHECFGMPVVEAMLRGTPVVASDAGSLPEVMGHGGLTAGVEDAVELAQQIQRMITPSVVPSGRKVALVTHRFGTGFAGGAEKSLRLMATSLQQRGYEVEVITTCNEHESRWANTLAAGTKREDGFNTHRFPIDNYDAERLGAAYEAIRLAEGKVSEAIQKQYLQHSLGSQRLIDALTARRGEFAAIITGPYLFKLVYDVACRFGDQVLLASCFHEEPLAKMSLFQRAYRQVGGLLFHTAGEAKLAAEELKINHPRHTIIGSVLGAEAFRSDAQAGRSRVSLPYLVYCGRYCPEKGLDRLLGYMEKHHDKGGEVLKLVCVGQGPMALPKRPWLVDMGFVSEQAKRDLIAGAIALVNLSRNESLSIVALEAWALGVPVIADTQCAVLRDQVIRAAGGHCVGDATEFSQLIAEWLRKPGLASSMGQQGNAFVQKEYASSEVFGMRLQTMIESLQKPLCEIAREQGTVRAREYSTTAWAERLSSILEKVQLLPLENGVSSVTMEPLQERLACALGTAATVTLRVVNRGTRVLPDSGPARARLALRVSSGAKRKHSVNTVSLPASIVPGQEQIVIAGFDLPEQPGQYRLKIRMTDGQQTLARCTIPLKITKTGQHAAGQSMTSNSLGSVLQSARASIAQAKRMEQLPSDYLDVCEGMLAGLKHALKRKLLNNFRKAYVDVAFRQQSALNEKLIAVMSLMLETLSAQDNGSIVADLQRRMQRLEKTARRERRMRRRLQRQLRDIQSPDVSLMEGDRT